MSKENISLSYYLGLTRPPSFFFFFYLAERRRSAIYFSITGHTSLPHTHTGHIGTTRTMVNGKKKRGVYICTHTRERERERVYELLFIIRMCRIASLFVAFRAQTRIISRKRKGSCKSKGMIGDKIVETRKSSINQVKAR